MSRIISAFKLLKISFTIILLLAISSCGNSVYRHLNRPGEASKFEEYIASTVALTFSTDSGRILYVNCTATFISPRELLTAHHCIEDNGVRISTPLPGVYRQYVVSPTERAETYGREVEFITFKQQEAWLNMTPHERHDAKEPESHISTVVAFDKKNDLAILRLKDTELPAEHWLSIRDTQKEPMRTGEELYSISNPVGNTWILSKGILSRIFISNNELRLLHQVRIGPGSSGSALLDRNGRIVGVNVAISRMNVVTKAIPVKYIKRLIEALNELDLQEERRNHRNNRAHRGRVQ